MTGRIIRYGIYLGYWILSGVAWLAIVVFGFGILPFPAERECDLNPPCPTPSMFEHGLVVLFLLGSLPVAMLGFVLLRNWLHRQVEGDGGRS